MGSPWQFSAGKFGGAGIFRFLLGLLAMTWPAQCLQVIEVVTTTVGHVFDVVNF